MSKLKSSLGTEIPDVRETLSVFKQTVECIVPDRSATYVAVPITSGKRLWELAAALHLGSLDEVASIDPALLARSVVNPNLLDAALVVARVRKNTNGIVVDPSQLLIPGWGQQSYYEVWRWLIETKTRQIVVSRDWAFSVGCVKECLTAIRCHLPIVAEDGSELGAPSLRKALESAQAVAAQFRLRVPFIEDALTSLA